MAYLSRPYELGYFARHEWADTPARMLLPLLVQALESSGHYRAVISGPSAAQAELRLDTEVLAFQQEFTGPAPEARVALRAQLVDLDSRRVVATRSFEATESAVTPDPYGGVVALNRALDRLLGELQAFATGASPPGR
jgi:cholesterol transport system auxiliary component